MLFLDWNAFRKGYREGEVEDQADQKFTQDMAARDLQNQKLQEDLDFLRTTNPTRAATLQAGLGQANRNLLFDQTMDPFRIGGARRRDELEVAGQPAALNRVDFLGAAQDAQIGALTPLLGSLAKAGAGKRVADAERALLDAQGSLGRGVLQNQTLDLAAGNRFIGESVDRALLPFRAEAAGLAIDAAKSESERVAAIQQEQDLVAEGLRGLTDPDALRAFAATVPRIEGEAELAYVGRVRQRMDDALQQRIAALEARGVRMPADLTPSMREARMRLAGRNPDGSRVDGSGGGAEYTQSGSSAPGAPATPPAGTPAARPAAAAAPTPARPAARPVDIAALPEPVRQKVGDMNEQLVKVQSGQSGLKEAEKQLLQAFTLERDARKREELSLQLSRVRRALLDRKLEEDILTGERRDVISAALNPKSEPKDPGTAAALARAQEVLGR